LGRNCIALGQWRAAEEIFRRILTEDATNAEAKSQLDIAARNAAIAPPVGRNDPCPCGSGKRYKHCHGAAAAAPPPETTEQKLQHALTLHARGDVDRALPLYQDVLAEEPDNPTARHYLGVIHYQRGNLSAALPLLERAVAAKPADAEFHNNLGLAMAAADRTDEAIAEYRATLALNPSHAVAWNNLGLALQAKNEVRDGIEAFRRALHLKPDFLRARWNLALALLLDRQFGEGWRHYDARLELPELGGKLHRFPGPVWDGTPGQTVLVYIEQGLGDAIQFARYARQIAAIGARCILRCPEALAPLLATVPGVTAVNLEREPLPPYDAYLPLLSLPRIFGTSPETIPADVPYLGVPEANRATTRRALAGSVRTRRIGICWAGNPAHANDRNRSIALALLAPLFAAGDTAWFSLQAGAAAGEQLATTPRAREVVPLPLGTELVDTSALIEELDLIVTVDTGIAHLAGALARPTWILLPYAPDWRWQLGRDDSPWYPTVRLFRQTEARDWPSVIRRVATELATEVLRHSRVPSWR
jgi:Flp pilus assembly protein TadD